MTSKALTHLLDNNRSWADKRVAEDPSYFSRLANQQNPEYFWIGCSDSRVPANQITDLDPGEVFVHRNVANIVVPSDLNCLSAMQFAVDVLKVKHILVVGHYGCGGVRAALENQRHGLVDNWLRHIKDVRDKHIVTLDNAAPEARVDRLCELNVIEQVVNVCQTTVLLDAWQRGQQITVHGWVYAVGDGLVRELGMSASSPEEAIDAYHSTLARVHKA
ncbi:MAG TPA: carbonate dehydratase [Rhodocyclaceae bacterium]|nr:carbonate dehydratase [Rhodocyclaceae bacterium]